MNKPISDKIIIEFIALQKEVTINELARNFYVTQGTAEKYLLLLIMGDKIKTEEKTIPFTQYKKVKFYSIKDEAKN